MEKLLTTSDLARRAGCCTQAVRLSVARGTLVPASTLSSGAHLFSVATAKDFCGRVRATKRKRLNSR